MLNTVESFGLDGKLAEEVLDLAGITTNKQIIPDDPNPPLKPSGIRIGTPAATTRGMVEDDMKQLGNWIVDCLVDPANENLLGETRHKVEEFCRRFPVPGLE